MQFLVFEQYWAQGHPQIHRSDQGVQNAAIGYTTLLHAAQVQINMSTGGRPMENAFAEHFI